MQICDPHIDAIESALTARGLGDLIPSPGDHHRLLRAWSKGILTLDTFDPLSMALGMIRRVVTETRAAHPETVYDMPDCPLCWIDENSPSAFEFSNSQSACEPDVRVPNPQSENWLLEFGIDCAVDLARKLSKENPSIKTQKKKENT